MDPMKARSNEVKVAVRLVKESCSYTLRVMDDTQFWAQLTIEARFRRTVDRDVELVARHTCREGGEDLAAERCLGSDSTISDLLWSHFSFDWSAVTYVYDGTYGHSSRFVWAKVYLTVAWARAGGQLTPEVVEALSEARRRLRELWVEWAGFQATTSDDLALAVNE